MGKTIQEFNKNTDEQFRKEYVQTLISNLSGLNKQEANVFIIIATVILIYFLVITGSITSINMGFVEVNKMDILIVYLPIVFIYTMFKSYSITFQIKETKEILDELLEDKLLMDKDDKIDLKSSRFSRAFYPYSFSNTARGILKKSPNIILTTLGFILLIPVLFISILPFGIMALMLIKSSEIYTTNIILTIGYYSTWWSSILLVFYIIMNGIKE
jgi:hypothetical protein